MRLLLLTGKGGAGTTTVAAATGVHAARRGTKTLVVSTGASPGLDDVLGVPLGCAPTEVEPSLFAQQLGSAQQPGVESGVEPPDPGPGALEVAPLLEVRGQARDGPWDLVVVDCGPNAAAVRLLALPEVLVASLDRDLTARRRMLAGLDPVPGRPRAGGSQAALLEAARLREAVRDTRAVLTDRAASVRLVLTPEAGPVAATRRTLTALALHGYPVDAVVANRLVPAGSAPWTARWAAAQAGQLAALRRAVAPAALYTADHADREPVGTDDLAALAAGVYGPDDDSLAPWEAPAPQRVERCGDDLVLGLALPLAAREDVGLCRRGDDLVVTVGDHQRVMTLPSVLRRCRVVGAALRQGWLQVRFTPDPELWRSL